MEYRQLGRSGLRVSALTMGTMTFGGSGGFASVGNTDVAEARRQIDTCLDAGVNLVDTADVYSAGASEEIVGEVLHGRYDRTLIATKARFAVGDGPNDAGLSRHHLVRACEASLRRLQTDHIDLYQVHEIDGLTPVDETLAALDDLVRSGKVRYVGASNFSAWRLAQALGVADAHHHVAYVSQQIYCSLQERSVEYELVPLALDAGLGILVWSPLAGGLLSGKFSREHQKPEDSRRSAFDFPIVDKDRAWRILDVLRPIAEARSTSVATVSLAWILSKRFVTSVLIGAKRPDQLRQNLAAADLELTPEEIKQLDEVSALPPEYPGWMIPFQNANRLVDVPRG